MIDELQKILSGFMDLVMPRDVETVRTWREIRIFYGVVGMIMLVVFALMVL